MSGPAPIRFIWDGEVMRPASPVWAGRADKQYVIGEHYALEQHEDRSTSSHGHYFASLSEAHRNLPEALAEEYPTVEHLRKAALIAAGFCNISTMQCAGEAGAQRVADFIRPLADYAVVTADKNVVTVRTAKSQSYRAMGKADFQRSKEAVLEIVADLVGVKKAELAANAEKAA